MSIQFVKTIDYGAVLDKIKDRIETARRDYGFFLRVLEVIKEHEGQALNKRIEGWVARVLPGAYHVNFKKATALYQLEIWGDGIPYNDRITFYLGHVFDDAVISVDRFIDQNRWAEAEKEKYETLEALIDDGRIALHKSVEEWNRLLTGLQAIHKWAKDFDYPLTSIFDISR